jgi:hypothetical protein
LVILNFGKKIFVSLSYLPSALFSSYICASVLYLAMCFIAW